MKILHMCVCVVQVLSIAQSQTLSEFSAYFANVYSVKSLNFVCEINETNQHVSNEVTVQSIIAVS